MIAGAKPSWLQSSMTKRFLLMVVWSGVQLPWYLRNVHRGLRVRSRRIAQRINGAANLTHSGWDASIAG